MSSGPHDTCPHCELGSSLLATGNKWSKRTLMGSMETPLPSLYPDVLNEATDVCLKFLPARFLNFNRYTICSQGEDTALGLYSIQASQVTC